MPWFHDNYFLKNFEDIKKNIKLIVTLGCYISLACVAIAPEAIMILGGNKYLSGVYCVPPIVLGILCQYIYTHYVNIELHLKKTMYVSAGTIFAAALNVILNAIFIPGYGFVAAAYTTLFSYICLLFIHFFIVRYILKIRLYSDSFMFGAILVTAIISMVLVWTYSHNILRFAIVAIGLISMAIVYRKFIFAWIEEMKKNLHQ